MSLSHSSGIVTDNLLLYYDMYNTKKSYNGKPAVNVITNADTMNDWTNYNAGTPVRFTTEMGRGGWGMYNITSWNGIYKDITLPVTGTYTFSAQVKWIGGSSNVTGGAIYVSGWGGADSAITTNRTLPGQWQKLSITLACTGTTPRMYLINWGGTQGTDSSSWEVTEPQIEVGSVATPFVNGTRTSDQVLLDLIKVSPLTNLITATSLTYDSDSVFSFNGSSDYLTAYSIYHNTADFTYSMWINWDTVATYKSLFENGVYTGGILFRYDSGSLVVYAQSTGYTVCSFTPTAGVWYNITLTRSLNTLTGYVNGVFLGSIAFGSLVNISPSTSYMYIGRSQHTTGQNIAGKIPIFQVYTKALSVNEVKQNFEAHRGRFGV